MANMNRHDPFVEMVDDFLKGFFVKPVAYQSPEPVRRMRIDLFEHDGDYRVLADLPGVKKEDIDVQIDGDEVSITAEARSQASPREGERALHSERYFGKMARAFRLQEEVDDTRATAKFADGVLELTLPKKSPASSKKVTIQ